MRRPESPKKWQESEIWGNEYGESAAGVKELAEEGAKVERRCGSGTLPRVGWAAARRPKEPKIPKSLAIPGEARRQQRVRSITGLGERYEGLPVATCT
jgi:hypothetical protein